MKKIILTTISLTILTTCGLSFCARTKKGVKKPILKKRKVKRSPKASCFSCGCNCRPTAKTKRSKSQTAKTRNLRKSKILQRTTKAPHMIYVPSVFTFSAPKAHFYLK